MALMFLLSLGNHVCVCVCVGNRILEHVTTSQFQSVSEPSLLLREIHP